MSVIEDLSKILQIKSDIYSAIREKGVDIPNNTPLSDYDEAIQSITGGPGSGDTDFSAMLVMEGIVTGIEPNKTQIENATAAVLSTI